MNMSINGLHAIIRTPIARFREEKRRDEMTFTRLTQEAQDIGNTFSLQMDPFHAAPEKSTRAATAKISHTINPTRQVHLMESKNSIREGGSLADEDKITDPDNSIDVDDVPSTNTANSEEYQQRLMLMSGRDNYQPRIFKPRPSNEKMLTQLESVGKRNPIHQGLSVIVFMSRMTISYRIANIPSPIRKP